MAQKEGFKEIIMKTRSVFFILSFFMPHILVCGISDVPFDEYFTDATMRVDFIHLGNAAQETIAIDQIYRQGQWAGNPSHPIDPFLYGRYAVKVYDALQGKMIFSKGFDSYFAEYKTTDPALQGQKKAFHESAMIPYPKKPVVFTIEIRNRKNEWRKIFSEEIDPDSVGIIKENLGRNVKVFKLLKSGDPHKKVDVACIAEGYTRQEEKKVRRDFQRFMDSLFSLEPYISYKKSFNVYGVFMPSEESGCDEPRHGIFKNTAVGASFNSLGLSRYLLTEDNKSLRDIAAHVPYDALFIMINQKRYGGGGIYNLFCTFTSDSQWTEYLILHEFGHCFAGLADEYYTSSVAYNEFYPRGIEPLEPNITALMNPDKLKWRDLVSRETAIPTPWEKEEYDRRALAYQKIRGDLNERIAAQKRNKAASSEIRELERKAERLSKEHAENLDALLARSQFQGVVGAFEGAGYSSSGLFRPMLDCIMFTKGKKPYCQVCEQAIIRVIKFYTD
jgi:hypothetical protein